jgi:hypothetical protein
MTKFTGRIVDASGIEIRGIAGQYEKFIKRGLEGWNGSFQVPRGSLVKAGARYTLVMDGGYSGDIVISSFSPSSGIARFGGHGYLR